MRLLTFRSLKGLALGIKTGLGIIDVGAAAQALGHNETPTTPAAFFSRGLAYLPELTALLADALPVAEGAPWLLDEATLQLGPAVDNPEKILCVGLNYRRHAAESGSPVPEVPVLFSKFNNTLAGHGEPIPLPDVASEYDYEVELAVVIGETAYRVPEHKALDYVLGYTNANDISARDLQRRTSQWLLGKTLDKFCPIGPYLITPDEVVDPQKLAAKSWLNGKLRQNSNTSDMVFTVAQIVSYSSQHFPLKSGDVILTGTPEGVILGMKEKVWMKPGDIISIEVGDFGKLTNKLIQAP
ncbi:MAG: fumarylacetoacetate hydrolase family protein [Anaerolineae bacterium]|nr:fumarylacetoacetate hydrolase family protein [Anaerolineae bacterium]